MELPIVLAALACIPAWIAYTKGRKPLFWWVYGLLVFPIAFAHAWLLQDPTDRELAPLVDVSASEGASRALKFGILGLVIWAIGGGIAGTWADERKGAAEQEAALEAQRLARINDSTAVAGFLSRTGDLTPVEVLQTVGLIEKQRFTIPHEGLRLRYIDLMLDSAAVLLKPNKDGWGAVDPAREILASLGELPEAQQKRRAALAERAEAQQARITAWAKKEAEKLMVQQRRDFADRLETQYLDQGMDIRVSVRGAGATTLRMEFVLFNRVWAHKFGQDAGAWATIRDAGFKRVEMSDGYDFSWYWTID